MKKPLFLQPFTQTKSRCVSCSVWGTQLWVGRRRPAEKQTLAMKWIHTFTLNGSSSRRRNEAANGCGDQLLTRYQKDTRDASINVFFFRKSSSLERESGPFMGARLILVWNEVRISRLKERRLCRKPFCRVSLQVYRGDLNKSAFEGSELGVLGSQAHMRPSAAVSGVCVAGPPPSLPAVLHRASDDCNHNKHTGTHVSCMCVSQTISNKTLLHKKNHFNP